jgi:ribosomal protein S18 acetylase RimI-like enzyme
MALAARCVKPYLFAMPITVRPARPDDADTIVAYNAAMAWETEKHTLDPAVLSRGVRGALADPAKARYFVGEIDNRVAGMLMLTLEWSDWRDGEIWWIQSVYVHPDFRRAGVFKAIYRHVEQLARQNNAVGLRLYVEKHNTPAQATYANLGMSLSHYLLMENLTLRE